jgi:hypothetical protein
MKIYQKNVKNLNITFICLFASHIMWRHGSLHITYKQHMEYLGITKYGYSTSFNFE